MPPTHRFVLGMMGWILIQMAVSAGMFVWITTLFANVYQEAQRESLAWLNWAICSSEGHPPKHVHIPESQWTRTHLASAHSGCTGLGSVSLVCVHVWALFLFWHAVQGASFQGGALFFLIWIVFMLFFLFWAFLEEDMTQSLILLEQYFAEGVSKHFCQKCLTCLSLCNVRGATLLN